MSEPLFARLKRLADKKTLILLLTLAAVGVILILFSPHSENASASAAQPAFDENTYAEQLEERTSRLLSGVQGVGEVRVMVTVDSYAQTKYVRDRTTESAVGGVEKQSESVVLESGTGGTRSPVTECIILPRVRGVSVVCTGGANAEVQMRVTKVLTALFDLRTSQISVTN